MSQTNNSNPFMFPGLGQQGDLGQNPMLASIEMMRQAWQNLAQAGAPHGLGMATPPMSIEELDRRIAELRTVENWLRMNLSMLTSTIQGLEVQRATISTLKSFVSPDGMSSDGDNPSALEVALGLKPSGQAKIKPARAAAQDPAGAPSRQAKAASSQGDAASADVSADAMKQGTEAMQQGSEAAQAWWSMLQNQFNTLASATSAGMPSGAEAGKAGAGAGAKKAASAAAAGAPAGGTSASSANAKSTMSSASAPKRTAAARARKQTTATTRKKATAARKTVARKRTAAKKTAG